VKKYSLVTPHSPQAAILDSSVAVVLPRLDLRSLSGQRLFITGGTGFFGLWLLSALRILYRQGVEVETCVLSRNPIAFLSRNPQFKDQPWLNFITGDVRNFEIPSTQFDLLLHAATETSMEAHTEPLKMFDDITYGTRRVLQLAQSCGVRRVLLISSGAVYGPQSQLLTHQPEDSLTACSPMLSSSAYGEGKRVMELMGAMFNQTTGIECVSARCFTVCGPGLPLDAHFAFGNFMRDAIYSNQITVSGDGTAKRSFLYGADLAVWLLFLLVKGESGVSYNVGSDEAISIKDLAFRVREIIAPHIPVKIMKNIITSSASGNNYVPKIERARELGCMPWTSLSESLIMTAKYVRNEF